MAGKPPRKNAERTSKTPRSPGGNPSDKRTSSKNPFQAVANLAGRAIAPPAGVLRRVMRPKPAGDAPDVAAADVRERAPRDPAAKDPSRAAGVKPGANNGQRAGGKPKGRPRR